MTAPSLKSLVALMCLALTLVFASASAAGAANRAMHAVQGDHHQHTFFADSYEDGLSDVHDHASAAPDSAAGDDIMGAGHHHHHGDTPIAHLTSPASVDSAGACGRTPRLALSDARLPRSAADGLERPPKPLAI